MKLIEKGEKETIYEVGPFSTEVDMLPVYVIVQLRAYGFGSYVNDSLPAMGLREAGVSLSRVSKESWIVRLNFYDGRILTSDEMNQIEEAVRDIQ